MATVNSIFSTARSGLSVAQNAAALATRNLANVGTPGYAREILPIAAALGGLGVTSGAPIAMRSALLERALQAATGRSSFHESQVSHLTIAEQAVNDLDGVGLGASIEDFRTALDAVAAAPSSDTARQSLLDAGAALGSAFSATRSQLDAAASGVREGVVATASQVSDLAAQIARVDQRVRGARPGDEKNTYIAQRTALVDTLSGLVDIDVRTANDGTLTVTTAGGRGLVDGGSASKLVVATAPPPDSTLSLSFERADGSKLPPIDGAELGGALGGLLAAHADTLMPALKSLDALAFDFVTTFNAAHAGGFTPSGAPGGDFFVAPSAVAGAAADVTLTPGLGVDDIAGATDPSAGSGDNTNLLRLADVAGQAGALPGGASLPSSWRDIGSGISHALATATTGAAFETASRDQLGNLLASESGVSIDEEMFNLTAAQTALEASSKVISTAQQMTDTVLSLIG